MRKLFEYFFRFKNFPYSTIAELFRCMRQSVRIDSPRQQLSRRTSLLLKSNIQTYMVFQVSRDFFENKLKLGRTGFSRQDVYAEDYLYTRKILLFVYICIYIRREKSVCKFTRFKFSVYRSKT